MEQGVERLVAIAFLFTGLSHLFAPGAWVAFFARLREWGEPAGLANALIHGPVGFLILAFHPVWSGPGLFITVIGAALTLKALLYGVWPALALRTMSGIERPWRAQAAGVVAITIGMASGWIAATHGG